MISLIWAMDKNNLIGKNNELPWHYKEDLKYFRNTIKNHYILLGDKTYESILNYRAGKQFPDVKHLVATIMDVKYENVKMVRDLNLFLKKEHLEEIFVCGGATIYNICMPYADRLYITYIDKKYEGDAYFPKINYNEWNLISSKQSENTPELSFCIYERK